MDSLISLSADEIIAETAESAIESKSVSNLTTDGPTLLHRWREYIVNV